jgi:chemotaxis signal transduction protein
MLMLLFRVGAGHWAIAASEIVSVAPLLDLQPISPAHPVVSGWLNYRGELLPAVDVSALITGQAVPQLLSSRILIIERAQTKCAQTERVQADGHDGPQTAAAIQKIALLVDQAKEMAVLSEPVHLPSQSVYTQAAFKGPQGEAVQQLAIAPLFAQLQPSAPELAPEPALELIVATPPDAVLLNGVS